MAGYEVLSAFYDRLSGDMRHEERAAYLLELIERHSGTKPASMLDLACGSGSLTLALAQQGVDMIGTDASAEMLALAAEKASLAADAASASVLWLQQDMRELDLYGTVDAAVCTMDGLNHLCRTEELREVLRRLSLFIAPDGCLVFDVNTPYKHREVLGDHAFVFEEPDFVCVWRNHWMARTGEVDMTLDFFVGQGEHYRRLTDTVRERAYSRRTWETLLQEAGFSTEAVYGDMTREPPAAQEERWVFVARNRRGKPAGEHTGR